MEKPTELSGRPSSESLPPTDRFVLRSIREQITTDPKFRERVLAHLTATNSELALQLPAMAGELAVAVTNGDIDLREALLNIALAVRQADETQAILNATSFEIPDTIDSFPDVEQSPSNPEPSAA